MEDSKEYKDVFTIADAILKIYKLNNLVKRKEDGKIGFLKIQNERVQFFPIKKDGTMSLIKDGYILNALEEFEPYNKGG